MGLVRALLAISVVAVHTGGIVWIGGRAAVLVFYMISGYLIALTFNANYRGNTLGFFQNRFLRIFVPLWVVMIPAWIAIWFIGNPINSHYLPIDIFNFVTSFTAIGQDLGFLSGYDPDNHLAWVDYGNLQGSRPIAGWSANPPIFSIALELYFYLLAPLFVTSARRTAIFAGLGALYLIVLVLLGNKSVAWWYHVPLASWFYFGSGALAWHLSKATDSDRNWLYLVLVAFSVAAAFFQIGIPLVYVLMIMGLPALSRISSTIPLDRYVGELSYPLYIVHYPLLILTRPLWNGTPFIGVLCLSIVSALLLHHLVEVPMRRVRDRVRSGGTPVAAQPVAAPA